MTQTEKDKLVKLMLQTSQELALIVRDFGPAPVEGLYHLLGPTVPRAAYDMMVDGLVNVDILSRETDAAGEVWLRFVAGQKPKTIN